MAAGPAKDGEPIVDVNTTPLIDVMLVLLIMLIITIPPQTHAVKLDMPRPQDNPPPVENPIPPVAINVDFDGTVYWNNEIVARRSGLVVEDALMQDYMWRAAQQPEQPEIHIRPHKLAQYGYVAHVMASAQRLGLTKMGVIGGTS
jgi:biopolymer transport protein ExbD